MTSVLPDGLTAGQIVIELVKVMATEPVEEFDWATFRELASYVDLEPSFEQLSDRDRRGAVGAAMFDLMGSDRFLANMRARADWIESTPQGRAECDDPHAVAEAVRTFARICAT